MLFSTNTSALSQKFGYAKYTELLCKAGFPALDFSFFSYAQEEIPAGADELMRELRAIADSHGVIFNQAHAPFGGGYEKYTSIRVPLMPEVFRLSSILGVRQIVIHPLQKGYYAGHEKELFEENLAFYRSLAPYAKEHGLRIAIENMWRRHERSGYIIDDVLAPPEELRDMYDALDDSETFTVCLDVGHVTLCSHREPADAIRILGRDRLGALHVHDTDYRDDLHTLPYMGKIDWESVISALAEIDYKGELTLEASNFQRNVPEALLPAALRYMAETAAYLAERIEAAKREVIR